MHQILEAGGEHDESVEPIDKWLTFLTDPGNLRAGLPDLTVYFGEARFCSIAVSFDSAEPSLRSLKIELNYLGDEYVIPLFQETDSQATETFLTPEGPVANPHRLKEWIFRLFSNKALEELEAEFRIREFPDLFHNIPRLKIARLNYSTFVRLPPSFYQLPALEQLEIRDAPIPELPFELGNLRALRHLMISQNCFPVAWSKLTALTTLEFYGSTSTVPGEMMALVNLESLVLTSVSDIRQDFFQFPTLKKLYFTASQHPANFRFTMCHLPILEELKTDDAGAFVNVFPALKTLERLLISGNIHESILPVFTQALKQLKNLTFLSIEKSNITNFDWCSSLQNLQQLCLDNNAITTIPLSLNKLQKLTSITLQKNPIRTLPDLEPMPNVTYINLRGTKIQVDQNSTSKTGIKATPEENHKLKRIFPNA